MQRKFDVRQMALTLLTVIGLLATGIAVPARADVTEENLADKVAEATTAADHEALAVYFRGVAAENGKKVSDHEAMMKRAIAAGGKPSAKWQTHCKGFIAAYGAAQKEAEGMAAEHERLAKEATK